MSIPTGQGSQPGDTKTDEPTKPKRGERKPLGKTFKRRGHEVTK